MKNKALLILSVLLTFGLFATLAEAQSNGTYAITQSVIAGGGGTSSNNNFSITGTAGQAVAGTVSSNGSFTLTGGFWAAAPAGFISISGQVTKNGAGLQGVTINLSGSDTRQATTDANGLYSFANLFSGGSFTVTPSLANHGFDPPDATFLSETSDRTANFIAAECSYMLSSNSDSSLAGGKTGSFTITAPIGCPYTAVSNDAWLRITGGGMGSGTGTVNYTVDPNSSVSRVGTITVAGQTFTVTQAAGRSIGGVIRYGIIESGQAQKIVPGAKLTASGTTTVMATSALMTGVYQLLGLESGGNYTVTPSKDDDRNGISTFDATLVLRCVAAGPINCTLTPQQKIAADTNERDSITSFDATLILRLVASGVPTANTGQAGMWRFDPASRPYMPLNSSPNMEDYTAYLLGEVNGNWMPPTSPNAIEEIETLQFRSEKENDEVQAGVQISLPNSLSPTNGNTILVPVMLSNRTGKEISGYAMDVTFNPAILKIDTENPLETNGTLTANGNFSIVANTETSGRIGIAAAGGSFVTNTEGTLVYLRFTIIGDAGNTKKGMNLIVTRSTFDDVDGIRIPSKSVKEQFNISLETTKSESASVSGRAPGKIGR